MTDNLHTAPAPETAAPASRKPLWRRALKWLGITAAVLAALFVLVCSLIVWILTPARLTPLVQEQASKYINGELRVQRVELTFWRTFPRMTVQVDSLRLVSASLDGVPDSVAATLPADWRELLSVGSFSGGINVLPLLKGDIALYDINFRGIDANLVATPGGRSNFDIVPPSETADTSAASIPAISLNRFGIDRATVKPGKKAVITVTTDPAVLDDMLNARISVITNDPADATRTIRAVAEITK